MNKQGNVSFRDQLLSQEKSDTQLQKNFQLEIKKMYTEKLKKGQRVAWGFLSFIIAFFTMVFWVMSKIFEEIQIDQGVSQIEPLRLGSMWAMYLTAVLLVLSLWPVIWGKVELRFYPKVMRFIFWMLVFACVFLSFAVVDYIRNETDYWVADTTMDLLGATIVSMLIIIMSIYMLLSGRIDRGDMKNKAKTLELEYRIVELEEKLNQGK